MTSTLLPRKRLANIGWLAGSVCFDLKPLMCNTRSYHFIARTKSCSTHVIMTSVLEDIYISSRAPFLSYPPLKEVWISQHYGRLSFAKQPREEWGRRWDAPSSIVEGIGRE